VLSNIDSSPCIQNIPYYKLSSIALKNNTSNVIVSSQYENGNYYSVSMTPHYDNSLATPSGGFYEGRVQSITALKEMNGNSVDAWSNVSRGPTWQNNDIPHTNHIQLPKIGSEEATLAIFNIDARNNLKWAQCFTEALDKDFLSLINKSVFINTENGLHIIYSKLTEKKKQVLSDILLARNGNYVIKPIISMNLKCTYLLDQSFQLDSNSMIIPCTIKGKLVFAKLIVK
jgi:hypothetical protein